ncbi:hypothetical protein [Chryseosolibacter indicus]|uniref:Outer membrane protein beta-barrel domain-containing protein n=1 Tax=Chryseosolibacter indicus TaxID=2782351 RepID=A0ABS5VNF4_9BACT|nr:hypothetical protein [Chryseosolibacter indicus]MBT1702374.1 hypothetical protein [Chryseosolibacter indicus]
MKKVCIGLLLLLTGSVLKAQQQADTVIVPLAKTSQIIFTIKDKSDLEILKHYNFQAMFEDILQRLRSDTSATDTTRNAIAKNDEEHEQNEEKWDTEKEHDDEETEDDEAWEEKVRKRDYRPGRTWQSFNFDLGINNYISDGDFPNADDDLYAVRPWGSWYVGINSTQRTRLARNFFIEWGLGLNWYNFKFEKDNVMVQRTDDGVEFVLDTRDVDHIKSKLSATYFNVSLIPVLDLGDHSRRPKMWDGYGSEFRIGLGPYVGYRLASKTKLVFKDDGDREKEKERGSFNLSNLRYGVRFQIGFRSTDFFINYDINELFVEGKGPKLNAVSFGIIF